MEYRRAMRWCMVHHRWIGRVRWHHGRRPEPARHPRLWAAVPGRRRCRVGRRGHVGWREGMVLLHGAVGEHVLGRLLLLRHPGRHRSLLHVVWHHGRRACPRGMLRSMHRVHWHRMCGSCLPGRLAARLGRLHCCRRCCRRRSRGIGIRKCRCLQLRHCFIAKNASVAPHLDDFLEALLCLVRLARCIVGSRQNAAQHREKPVPDGLQHLRLGGARLHTVHQYIVDEVDDVQLLGIVIHLLAALQQHSR
mmetsp:Transcript_9279/g.23691  ORF Transcript_9279/g.23691 Transcript_9279/m.23691 type:complete len:249 (+) Transcript_9279:740-1486(+)